MFNIIIIIILFLDSETNQVIDQNAKYSWIFTNLDGTPVDSSILLDGSSDEGLKMDENEPILELNGIRQTSNIQGRCLATIPTSLTYEGQTFEYSNITYYSPEFRFDILDHNGKRDMKIIEAPSRLTKIGLCNIFQIGNILFMSIDKVYF